ncbi:fumarylacetoacetate hydrolase family protein [Halomonas organivorans]|uniref:2-keto-4-pentenoate hydratase n=1 Tax=Halomonas organivorans TaxID=257772 RepID=A0A7W5G3Q8_9GAMM|nr:fumarylacetoacetate hydrolase family protein [Halomonas organivorans]MBB3139160.1 2-keto-4-pentenoate hydratase [Halomonas organivorans]
MIRDEIISAGAERLIAAHREGRAIPVPHDIPLAEEADAYAIQERVSATLGTDAGWKLGGIVRGETPRYSRLFVERNQASPGSFRRCDHYVVFLEPELAVVLGEDIPVRDAPYTLAEIAARVASLHAAIEVVDSRFDAWPEVPALWQLADGLSHGGFVLGSGVAPGALDQMVDAEYRLILDGREALAGRGEHPGGDPAALLVEMVNARIARDGEGFAAGEVITTGTFDGVVEMPAGQRARLVFAGIGEASLHLAP